MISRRRAAAGSQYALVVGLVGIVALAAVGATGDIMGVLMTRVSNTIGGGGNQTQAAPPAATQPQAPTGIALSSAAIDEGVALGSTVGTLSATDADGGPHVFALAPGAGATDNSGFAIDGAALKTAAVMDFETKPSHSIRLRATDPAGLFVERALTITVNDIDENALVPGDTARIVSRNNVQVRCSMWSGRHCLLPEFNFTNSTIFQNVPNSTNWARPYMRDFAPNTIANGCAVFCSFATGIPAHDSCTSASTGYQGHPWRLTGIDATQSGARVVTAPSGHSFTAYFQETDNPYFNRVTCSAW